MLLKKTLDDECWKPIRNKFITIFLNIWKILVFNHRNWMFFHCVHIFLPLYLKPLKKLTSQHDANIWEIRSKSVEKKMRYSHFLNEYGEWTKKPLNKLFSLSSREKTLKYPQDIKLLGWCPVGPVLLHAEVPL